MSSLLKIIIEVLGVTLPIFAVIAIGFFIKKRGVISDENVPVLNKLTYNFGLSALVFIQIAENKFSDIFDAKLLKVLFPTYFSYIIIIFFALFFTKINLRTRSAMIVSSFRNNMAFIGMPILLYAFGALASAKASIVIAFLLPLNVILTALFFQFFGMKGDSKNTDSKSNVEGNGNGRSRVSIGRMLKEIFLDPVIIAVIAGLIISYFNVSLPKPVSSIFNILSDMAVPLALISIGASFKFSHVRNHLKYISIISAAKLILFPLISLMFSLYVFKLDSLDMSTLCILFATPVAVATYIQGQKYDTDTNFISSVIITSTIASAVSLTMWLFILKMINS